MNKRRKPEDKPPALPADSLSLSLLQKGEAIPFRKVSNLLVTLEIAPGKVQPSLHTGVFEGPYKGL